MEDPIRCSTSDFPCPSSLPGPIDSLQSTDPSITTPCGAKTLDEPPISRSFSIPTECQSCRDDCALDQDLSHAADVYRENSLIEASYSFPVEHSRVSEQDVSMINQSETTTATDGIGFSTNLFIGERHTCVVCNCGDEEKSCNHFDPRTSPNQRVCLQCIPGDVSKGSESTSVIESPSTSPKRNTFVLINNLAEDDDPPTDVGAGLVNLGNTCFMNSILQCFTHTVPLIKAILSFQHNYPCHSSGFCVFCALREHIELAVVSSGKILSPTGFFNNLSYISSCFQRFQQEDAHEYLQCFLDKLDRICPDTNTPEKDSPLSANKLVEQVFGGRLISKLWCNNCGHCSERFEPLIDMSLEIEEVSTLQNALQSFTRVEKIEDSDVKIHCQNCEQQSTIKKQLMLDQLPQVATFHLKRFKTDGYFVEKINKPVTFPLELDMKPYTNSHQENETQLKYKLFAVVVHHGSLPTSGHYLSYVRTSPTSWYRMDDEMVTDAREEDVLSEAAYLLFYAEEGSPCFSDFAKCHISGAQDSSEISPNLPNKCTEKSPEAQVHDSLVDAALDDCDERSVKIEFAFLPNDGEHPATPKRKDNKEHPGEGCRTQHSSKRSKKSPELEFDSEKKQALRYVNRSFMPAGRKSLLLSAMASKGDGSRVRAYPCKKTLPSTTSTNLDRNVGLSR